jgi:hypothetical protein
MSGFKTDIGNKACVNLYDPYRPYARGNQSVPLPLSPRQ